MKVIKINKIERSKINKAVRILKVGGIVIFPTDTVYGIGALAINQKAIKKIYAIKKRSFNKPLPILLASKKEIRKFAKGISPLARILMKKFWPGPLTIVLSATKTCPYEKQSTVALRIPRHKIALDLIRKTGPLAVTSANLSGVKSARNINGISPVIIRKADFILDGGRCPIGVESTVVKVEGKDLKILREGYISAKKLQEAVR